MQFQDELTHREIEILELIDKGFSNKEIGEHLILSLHTVKWYIKQIFAKLQVQRRTQAVARAKELGIIGQLIKPASQLPLPLIPLIGRERAIHELTNFLTQGDTRLLTIVGLGGSGKTHIALHLAPYLEEHFPGHIHFVPLVSVQSAENILPHIMRTLGIETSEETRPQQQLIHFLNQKPTLLILDNCEHLLDGMLFINELLIHAPKLQVLATSRDRLHLLGEKIYFLQGLDSTEAKIKGKYQSSGASDLFAYIANQTNTEFTLTESNQGLIARICNLLDGLPLAIVLAASWTNALSIADILSELEDSFELLQSDAQNIPDRHQNIRRVLDHSWKLLTDKQQDALMSLALFQGSFTRDAIYAIADIRLPLLSDLISKSLVMQNQDLTRYHLHELIRQYLLEKLKDNGQFADDIQKTHCDYYLNLLHRQSYLLKGKEQVKALNNIHEEYANIRQAWYYAIAIEEYKRLAPANDFWLFFEIRGRYNDGLELFQDAMKAIPDNEHKLTGQLRIAIGILELRQGHLDSARASLETSIEELYRADAKDLAILAIITLGSVCYLQYDDEKAEEYYKEALIMAEEYQDDWCLCTVIGNLAYLKLGQKQYEEAEHFLQQEQALLQKLEDYYGWAFNLNHQGDLARDNQSYRVAETFYKQSLELGTKTQHQQLTASCYERLGMIARLEDNDELSLSYLEHSYDTYLEITHLTGMHATSCMIIEVLLAIGDTHTIHDYLRQAQSLAQIIGIERELVGLFLYAQLLVRQFKITDAMFIFAYLYQHEASTDITRKKAQSYYEDICLHAIENYPAINDNVFDIPVLKIFNQKVRQNNESGLRSLTFLNADSL